MQTGDGSVSAHDWEVKQWVLGEHQFFQMIYL